MNSNNETSYSLLERALDHNDTGAWNQLIDTYDNFVYYLLRKSSVLPDDLDDLRQQVMSNLARKLENYDREKGGFRTWFSFLVRSTVQMHFRKLASESKKISLLEEHEGIFSAQEDQFDQYFVRQWENYLGKIALQRAEEQYNSQAVQVFRWSLAGVSTEEIASRTQLSVDTVYKYKQRVKRTLMVEISKLKEEVNI